MLPCLISQKIACEYGIKNVLQIVYFAVLFSIALFGFSSNKNINSPQTPIAIFVFLVLFILLSSHIIVGKISLTGYKVFAIPFLMLLGYPSSKYFETEYFCKIILITLFVYIFVSFFLLVTGHGRTVSVSGLYTRFDLTGSVTGHAILCALFIMFSLSFLLSKVKSINSIMLVIGISIAFYMLLKTGSRQSILILIMFFSICAFLFKENKRNLIYSLALLSIFASVFSLYTVFVDNSFYYRFFSLDSSKFTSGRSEAIIFWLNNVTNHFIGNGLGYIAQYTSSQLTEIETYERFPHNEFVRFYVEGGLLGVVFIVSIFFIFFSKCLQIIRNDSSLLRKYFAAAFLSVFLVNIFLENLIFDIYKTSFYFFSVFILWSLFTRENAVDSINKPHEVRGE